MGGSASKASRAAAKSAADTTRRYPTRPAPRPAKPTSAPPTEGPASTLRAPLPGPTVHPATYATENRDASISLDASDPDLALNANLRQLGPVQPNPTLSNSSTFNRPQRAPPSSSTTQNQSSNFQASVSAPMQTLFPSPETNPAVALLIARQKLVEEAEAEIEDVGRLGKARKGRKIMEVGLIKRALYMRDRRGTEVGKIEAVLGLERGVLERLGRQGVIRLPDNGDEEVD